MTGQKPLQNNGNFTTVTIGKVNNRKSDQLTKKRHCINSFIRGQLCKTALI